MTVTFSVVGEEVRNSSSLSGAPAVDIVGNAILFTNTDRGRLTSTSATTAALTITGEGIRVINESGSLINSSGYLTPAITGSRFGDIVDNYGVISGVVQLGGGNDSYIQRTSQSVLRLEFAEGDDRLEIIGSNFQTFYGQEADGGTGEDTLVLSGSIGQLTGAVIRSFEHLVLGPYAENLEALSGFKSITVLGRPEGVTYTSVGLLNADNPGVDIVFAGSNNFRIGGSSRFADIIATPGADSVEIFAYSGGSPVSSGAVLLGDGDDTFRIIQSAGGTVSIANGVNGGAGFDRFDFSITDGATFDASGIVGFESFNAGSWTSATTNARITGLNGYLEGTLDTDGGMLTIAASASPLGSIRPLTKAAVVFESTAR